MRTLLAALFFVVAAADAGATIMYKLVDPLGNITFSDTVPRGFTGSVTRLDIDTGSNLITPSQAEAPSVLRTPVDDRWLRPPQAVDGEQRLRLAQERVNNARAALDHASNNSTAEDWIYYAQPAPSGARRGPRPEYLARLQRLEAELAMAEAAYADLRRELL